MKRIIAALLVALASAGIAHAEETLRCGSKIVRVGMTSDEVRKYCGAPTNTEVEDHDVRAGTGLHATTAATTTTSSTNAQTRTPTSQRWRPSIRARGFFIEQLCAREMQMVQLPGA
jgi:hypothetical protein